MTNARNSAHGNPTPCKQCSSRNRKPSHRSAGKRIAPIAHHRNTPEGLSKTAATTSANKTHCKLPHECKVLGNFDNHEAHPYQEREKRDSSSPPAGAQQHRRHKRPSGTCKSYEEADELRPRQASQRCCDEDAEDEDADVDGRRLTEGSFVWGPPRIQGWRA